MVRGWESYDSWRLASPYDGNGEWEKALEWAWEAWEEVEEEVEPLLFTEWRKSHPFVPESQWEARTYYIGTAYFLNGKRGVNRTFFGDSPKNFAIEKWVEAKAETYGDYDPY